MSLLPYVALALAVVGLYALPPHYVHSQARGYALPTPFQILALGVLVIFAGSRLDVGTDFELYAAIFNSLAADDWGWSLDYSPHEVGFTVLSLFVKQSGGGSQALFMVTSSISVLATAIAIHRYSPRPTVSIACYLLFGSYLAPLNTVRQGVAVAIVLIAVAALSKGERKWPVALIALACTFHISAILAFILYLCSRSFRATPGTVCVGLVAAVALGRAIVEIPGLVGLLAVFNERYSDYALSEDVAGFGTMLVALTHSAIAVVLLRTQDSLAAAERRWLGFYALTGPLALLGTSIPIATRLSEYTGAVLILLAASFLKGRQAGPYVACFWLLGSAYFVAYLLNYGGLLPYQSVL